MEKIVNKYGLIILMIMSLLLLIRTCNLSKNDRYHNKITSGVETKVNEIHNNLMISNKPDAMLVELLNKCTDNKIEYEEANKNLINENNSLLDLNNKKDKIIKNLKSEIRALYKER
jgi:competence protein ComGC